MMINLFESIFNILTFKILNIPFIVLWLGFTGIFLTFKYNFINISKIGLSVNLLRKNQSTERKDDTVSPFAAFISAAGCTFGLGNLIGGTISVVYFGAGTLFWIIVFGFLASIVKFNEVTLSHKYRANVESSITGGPFFYLENGLKKMGFTKIGKFIAITYTVAFMGAFIVNQIFQSHQVIHIFSDSITFFKTNYVIFVLTILLSSFIGFEIFGGISRISNVSKKMVPLMLILHTITCFFIIFKYWGNISSSFVLIFQEAFTLKGQFGGLFAIMVYSAQRILLATDAGTGASAIANSNSNTEEHVEQGIIAMLDPLLASIVMLITGFVVLIVMQNTSIDLSNLSGIKITKAIFMEGGGHIALAVLIFNTVLFGITTMMAICFYIEKSANYFFKNKYIKQIRIFCIVITFLAPLMEFKHIILIIDVLFFLATIPNLIGLLVLSDETKKDLKDYLSKNKQKRL